MLFCSSKVLCVEPVDRITYNFSVGDLQQVNHYSLLFLNLKHIKHNLLFQVTSTQDVMRTKIGWYISIIILSLNVDVAGKISHSGRVNFKIGFELKFLQS